MSKETALQIIKQVCENFKGTLAEHQQIQTALAAIEASFEKPDDATPKTK